jgi:hypothetical protein
MIGNHISKEEVLMRFAGLLFVLMLVVAVTPLIAAPATMQEGNWEITMKMEMAGMPFAMPPVTVTHCYTKDDVKDSKKTIPSTSQKKDDCEAKDVKVIGNKITWRVQCKDGSTGTGEMEQKQSSYAGKMTMEVVDKNKGKSKMAYQVSGKRLGDCK